MCFHAAGAHSTMMSFLSSAEGLGFDHVWTWCSSGSPGDIREAGDVGGGGHMLPGSREAGQGGRGHSRAAADSADPSDAVSPWRRHAGDPSPGHLLVNPFCDCLHSYAEPRALQGGVGVGQSQVCQSTEITGHVVPEATKGLVEVKEMREKWREKGGGGMGKSRWGAQLHQGPTLLL